MRYIDQTEPLYYSGRMRFSDFEQFCAYMDTFTNLEKHIDTYTVRLYRLDRMYTILEYIGHPERAFRSIHVAGSKGKGSTACFIAKGLEAAGYKTGLYLSPHLCDYRERFTLAGEFFADSILIETANILVERMEGFYFEDEWGKADPTTFELYTCFAYLLFSHTGCEWAVIETGLGGRLDATNTIIPQASVITPIELEHTAILGNTITLIAREKSKIIKEKVPVFISRQPIDALRVFEAEAEANHARLYDLEAEVESIASKSTLKGEQCTITWRSGECTNLLLSMRCEVQAENCALALLVLKTLGLYRQGITEAALERAALPGRMEIIFHEVPIVIDGAHTPESLRHVLNSFVQLFDERGNTVMFGSLSDKDHLHMVRLLIPLFDRIIVCRAGTFKPNDPDALFLLIQKEIGGKDSPRLYLEKDPDKALDLALRITPPGSSILCTGSFYLGGEIMSAWEKRELLSRGEVACP